MTYPTAARPPSHTTLSQGWWRETRDSIRTVFIGLAAAMMFHTVLFQPFTIPSSSMEPGLVSGDYILVSKLAYGLSRASLPFDPPVFSGRIFDRTAARGDVVVFRLPRDSQQTWIKRVIGLPGDRIQILGGVVHVNGRGHAIEPMDLTPGPDSSARPTQVREIQPDGRSYMTYNGLTGGAGADTGVYLVPEGFYFVMGDHRDNSLDSRWPRGTGVGLLPAENLIGRAELVVLSWRPGAGLYKPWTWLDLRAGRFLIPIR